MGKIVVPTKFNKTGKTGKRVLTPPLDDEKVSAPAYHLFRKACRAAQSEWSRKRDRAKLTYVERLAHCISSYVAKDSTPATDKYMVTKFLAEQILTPINVEGPGPSGRWSDQLGGIPELSNVEEETWEAYVETTRKAEVERETALSEARLECGDMKRALFREITDRLLGGPGAKLWLPTPAGVGAEDLQHGGLAADEVQHPFDPGLLPVAFEVHQEPVQPQGLLGGA